MKKIKLVLALVATMTVFGQNPPPVGDSTSGAAIPSPSVIGPTASTTPATKYKKTGRQVELTGQNAPVVDIRIMPVILPAQQDPDFWPPARILVANRRAGISDVVGLCQGKIVAANLAAGPTNNWWVVQQLIDVRSIDGEETVDLAGIQVKSISSPSQALNSVYGVGDRGYGSAAIGVRKDGTLITSGPPTQKVSRVIFITQMALFFDNLAIVESWVNDQEDFTVKYEVRYRDSSYIGKGQVSIGGYTLLQPMLVVSRHDGHVVIGVAGGDSHRPYLLQSALLVNSEYQTVVHRRPICPGDILSPTDLRHGDVTHPQEFFRLVGADW